CSCAAEGGECGRPCRVRAEEPNGFTAVLIAWTPTATVPAAFCIPNCYISTGFYKLQSKKPFRMCSTPHTKGLFLLFSDRGCGNHTSSIIAVSAASPRRTPVQIGRAHV